MPRSPHWHPPRRYCRQRAGRDGQWHQYFRPRLGATLHFNSGIAGYCLICGWTLPSMPTHYGPKFCSIPASTTPFSYTAQDWVTLIGFRQANLSRAQLGGANLSYVDLSRANLSEAMPLQSGRPSSRQPQRQRPHQRHVCASLPRVGRSHRCRFH
jgi:hypothetical protein